MQTEALRFDLRAGCPAGVLGNIYCKQEMKGGRGKTIDHDLEFLRAEYRHDFGNVAARVGASETGALWSPVVFGVPPLSLSDSLDRATVGGTGERGQREET